MDGLIRGMYSGMSYALVCLRLVAFINLLNTKRMAASEGGLVSLESISRHANDNTLGGGSLGSYVDEERSELRELM